MSGCGSNNEHIYEQSKQSVKGGREEKGAETIPSSTGAAEAGQAGAARSSSASNASLFLAESGSIS
jgi:hypothetical protein